MGRKKKILKHPEIARKSKQLKGFEDVLDLLPGSRFEKNNNIKLHDNFALLNLLEVEIERLGRLNTFLGDKIENMRKYGQSDNLASKQRQSNERKLESIINEAIKPTSILNQNIKLLFSQAFSFARKQK